MGGRGSDAAPAFAVYGRRRVVASSGLRGQRAAPAGLRKGQVRPFALIRDADRRTSERGASRLTTATVL